MNTKLLGKDGFTLVEIMIAIGLIAILSAIATPTILTWIPSSRLQSTARQLMADMQQAKVTAIKENATVTLTFNTVAAAANGTCAGGGYTFSIGAVNIINKQMINGLCIASALDGNLTPPIAIAPPPAGDLGVGDGFTPRGLAANAIPGVRVIAVTDNSLRSDAVYVISQSSAGGITLNRF